MLSILLNKIHNEVNPSFALEHIVHANNEGVIYVIENVFLELDVIKLFVINNSILSDTLHSVEVLGIDVLHKEHLSEGSLSNHLQNGEVL